MWRSSTAIIPDSTPAIPSISASTNNTRRVRTTAPPRKNRDLCWAGLSLEQQYASRPVRPAQYAVDDHSLGQRPTAAIIRLTDSGARSTGWLWVQPHVILRQSWRVLRGEDRGAEVAEITVIVDDYADASNDEWGVDTLYSKFKPRVVHA